MDRALNLANIIRDNILSNGPISFMDFMQKALYTPNLGYYSANFDKIGKNGDFTTAPEISFLFGQTLASQCFEIMKNLNNPCILEFGAGNGSLCVSILQELEKLSCLPEKYYILDLSGYLKLRQKQLIQEKIPHLLDKIVWLGSLPKEKINGILLANEVLDAMPVCRFLKKDDNFYESYINFKDNQFYEEFLPSRNKLLLQYLKKNAVDLPQPYSSEVNIMAEPWLKECFDILQEGVLLLIDYGFPRHEYFHQDRKHGTLMCHYKQKLTSNPFINIGLQDITAHVDFTHIVESATNIGFELGGYTNQAAFLINNGILTCIENLSNDDKKFHIIEKAKILLQAHEMGEIFKVMALTKNFTKSLQGFAWQDKSHSL